MRWFRGLPLALAAILGTPALSADAQTASTAELAELCKSTLCRAPKVRLFIDATRSVEQDFATPFPILQPAFLSIYPGETLFVEASIENEKLTLERAVPTNERPESTLRFEFKQASGEPDMLLVIRNPFEVPVRFRMGLMRPDSNVILATSSCSVPPKLSLVEHWPYPIFVLVLADPEVVGPTDSVACR